MPSSATANTSSSSNSGSSMKFYVPIFLWMLLIFISSSIPSQAFPDLGFWGWGKLVHIIYFGVLALLIRRAIDHQNKYSIFLKHDVLFSILFAVVYGATDEFHQLYTTGRHADVTDVFIDALGASLFLAGAKVYRVLKERRKVGIGG
jgi:hypothetical protein